jgi:hypothetical protein
MMEGSFVHSCRRLSFASLALGFLSVVSAASAQNQTPTLSPIVVGGDLPYEVNVYVRNMGSATIPTLQSFAFGQLGDEWVIVAGRTNGLHNFSGDGTTNFPPQFQNTNVWVIDPVAQQSWSRSLTDPSAGLTAAQVDSLSATNTEFFQNGTTLYVAGGYVYDSVGNDFTTYDTLSALDLPGVVAWVKDDVGSLAANLRQLTDPVFKVTGGIMQQIDGRTLLVFGQDFEGPYTPGVSGVYTHEVRSFDIDDDGGELGISNLAISMPIPAYRRRDLNVVPFLHNEGPGTYTEGLIAFSGVFTEAVGVWTVPVEITAAGVPSMADPNDPNTFKQGMNNYDSPTISLYRTSDDSTHTLVFGGISLQFYDEETSTIVTDNNAPFIKQSTSIVRSSAGAYTQYLLESGAFPTINGVNGPLLFGAGARFFPAGDVPMIGDLVDLDSLGGSMLLGQIYGGIMATAPNNGPSTASSYVFDVVLTAPEAGELGSLLAATVLCALARRRRRQATAA